MNESTMVKTGSCRAQDVAEALVQLRHDLRKSNAMVKDGGRDDESARTKTNSRQARRGASGASKLAGKCITWGRRRLT